jgi:branched-chain amino acid transport system permease protein
MEGIILLIWGPTPLAVKGVASSRLVILFGARVTVAQIVLVVVAITFAVGAHYWLRMSKIGIASLATAEDREAAMVRGINVRRLSVGAFAVAGGMLGGIGPIAGPITFAVYDFGFTVVLYVFVAMAIGGFGHNIGALIGCFGLGIFQAYIARYMNASWSDILTFALLLSVLLIRPQGLFGQRNQRLV